VLLQRVVDAAVGTRSVAITAGPNAAHLKEIVPVEGPSAGSGRWNIGVDNIFRTNRDRALCVS
jgi:hypothetical protein